MMAKFKTLASIVLWAPLAAMIAPQGVAATTITLHPGDDIQSKVNAASTGTAFVLTAGVYRMQGIKPKNGDTFTGQGSVTLNGSQVLTFALDPAGSKTYVASATSNPLIHGTCQPAYPLCGYLQDLFIDNVLQVPVGSRGAMKAGTWYFDHNNNKVYLPTNPAGHTVEIGMQQYAFSGGASNVQISNMIVEKYASMPQGGAVGGSTWVVDGLGSGWIVTKVEARWNHGGGIVLGNGGQILNSYIHHNGQIGIKFIDASNCKAVNNEIAWNNYAGFATNWEAGGSKFWDTNNLLVQSNYVHDNIGQGFWSDDNNVNTTYDSNTVVNNTEVGILYEISYKAIIKNNTVKGNWAAATGWVGNSQIQISSSQNVEITGNTIEVGGGYQNGIVIVNQTRGDGSLGPWIAQNNYVHNNTITHLSSNGQSGITDLNGGTNSLGNRFDNNHYITPDGAGAHWYWFGHMAWSPFQKLGQESHGICCK